MTRSLITFLLFVLIAASQAHSFEGPLTVLNQFPLHMGANRPLFEGAEIEDSLTLGLSHSSIYVMKHSDFWSFLVDMEMTELNLHYRAIIAPSLELGLEIPFFRPIAGFLDRPLDWYHQTFGLPDYGRNRRPRNEFLYEVTVDGQPVVQVKDAGAKTGDFRIGLKKMFGSRAARWSLKSTIELPTGNARAGFGNGSIDGSLGIVTDVILGDRSMLHGSASVIVPGDLKGYQRVDLKPYYHAGAGLEYAWDQSLALLGQLTLQTSPLPKTGIAVVDRPSAVVIVGARFYRAAGSYDLSLAEDLNTSGAPDFILNLTWRANF